MTDHSRTKVHDGLLQNVTEVCEHIVAARRGRVFYAQIAADLGITENMARFYARRAVKLGMATREELGFRSVKRSSRTAEDYNRHWLEKVKSKCRIDKDGCWIWTGFVGGWGYGETVYRKTAVRVHRKTLEITQGMTLDRWEYACHTCDKPLCCNPDHLWKGTPKENQEDCVQKRRHAHLRVTHCPRGHEYTPETTYATVSAAGRPARMCRICSRIKNRLKAGWSEEEATSLAKVPSGYTKEHLR